jgi:hypothetical protein
MRRIITVPTTTVPGEGQGCGVSSERVGGSQGEPGEAEHDQPDAGCDDHIVNQGFEVARVEGCEVDNEGTSRRAE